MIKCAPWAPNGPDHLGLCVQVALNGKSALAIDSYELVAAVTGGTHSNPLRETRGEERRGEQRGEERRAERRRGEQRGEESREKERRAERRRGEESRERERRADRRGEESREKEKEKRDAADKRPPQVTLAR